jgi:hypothetical protein
MSTPPLPGDVAIGDPTIILCDSDERAEQLSAGGVPALSVRELRELWRCRKGRPLGPRYVRALASIKEILGGTVVEGRGFE